MAVLKKESCLQIQEAILILHEVHPSRGLLLSRLPALGCIPFFYHLYIIKTSQLCHSREAYHHPERMPPTLSKSYPALPCSGTLGFGSLLLRC